MQNLHFLSLLALPTPCILKSLTAFLVLNINRILAESSVRAGGLRPQRHGARLLFCVLLAIPKPRRPVHPQAQGQWPVPFRLFGIHPLTSGNGAQIPLGRFR